MTVIEIRIGPPNPLGELLPVYDREADLLAATGPSSEGWDHGADIDGTVIFDLGSSGLLLNVDVLVGRRRWQVDPRLSWPETSAPGSVTFTERALAKKSFHLETTFRTSPARDLLAVDFGDRVGATSVRLSDRCVARVAGPVLTGFRFRLSDSLWTGS